MKHVLGVVALLSGLNPVAVLAKGGENNVGISLETGPNGNYGLLGLEGAYIISQRFDFHAGVGFGPASVLRGGGVRIYTDPSDCFLFKHCAEAFFLGTTFSQTVSSQVTQIGDDKVERKYRIPRTSFVNANVGNSTVFFNHLNLMLHVGYKFALQKNEPELISGPSDENSSNDIKSALQSGAQVSIAAGFLF